MWNILSEEKFIWSCPRHPTTSNTQPGTGRPFKPVEGTTFPNSLSVETGAERRATADSRKGTRMSYIALNCLMEYTDANCLAIFDVVLAACCVGFYPPAVRL
ncbi:hypothetical protein APHAL10511_005067 [Amanita phalloides]|nr:hypothetical protein APHAL10511_005067 [Amanita phalloides]